MCDDNRCDLIKQQLRDERGRYAERAEQAVILRETIVQIAAVLHRTDGVDADAVFEEVGGDA